MDFTINLTINPKNGDKPSQYQQTKNARNYKEKINGFQLENQGKFKNAWPTSGGVEQREKMSGSNRLEMDCLGSYYR